MVDRPRTTSWASDEATRKKMQGNRSRDTKPELLVRSVLHRRGLRYRVDQRPLLELRRTADIVFRKACAFAPPTDPVRMP